MTRLGAIGAVVLVVQPRAASAEDSTNGGSNARISGRSAPCPCTERRRSGDRKHDGFFAEADAGIAVLHTLVETTPSVPPFRTGIHGIGQSAEIAIGATPWNGTVIGASLWTARIDPTFVEKGHTVSPDDDSVKITLARFGPFLNWYPWSRRGFHSALSAGVAFQVESDAKGNPMRPPALGAAVSAGTGYEWFVASEVSLGFFARLSVMDLARRTNGADERTLSAAPELLLSYTYH